MRYVQHVQAQVAFDADGSLKHTGFGSLDLLEPGPEKGMEGWKASAMMQNEERLASEWWCGSKDACGDEG